MDRANPRCFTVIDPGSNTARLLIKDATPGYSYRLVYQVREVVRLRQGMTENGLSEAAMTRGVFTVSERTIP